MNFISNIWKHPKTSATGLLIAITSISGVLSQQGITLGAAGTGTVVTLASAVATALLGLLSKDPGPAQSIPPSPPPPISSTNSTAKLGAWALIALLLPLPFVTGCSATKVAQDIVNWTPALESAVATVDSTAALLMPADAPIFAAATVGFDAASNLLIAQARAYLANPSVTALSMLQNAVVTFQQTVSRAVLQAVKITNQASQQHVLAALNGVATVVTAILALVQSISSKASLAQMSAHSTLKLAQIEPYLNREQSAAIVAGHYGEPVGWARGQVALAERNEVLVGF